MANLIENARNAFDYVVVDLAALAPSSTPRLFAPLADGILFVVEWGRTPSRLVRDLLNSEPLINSKVLGVILNKTDMNELGKYSDFDGAGEIHATATANITSRIRLRKTTPLEATAAAPPVRGLFRLRVRPCGDRRSKRLPLAR
ncbi:hypothetical protein F2981_22875 (plasmid) [Sinorhizobium meliloti]|nr:hypothetical protein [Sinorhizobium meliloti]